MAQIYEDSDKVKQRSAPPMQIVQPKPVQPQVQQPAVMPGAVAKADAPKPRNSQYNIMRGLMGQGQTTAATGNAVGNLQQQGSAIVGGLKQGAADYTKANTITGLPDIGGTPTAEDYLNDPTLEGGLKMKGLLSYTAPDASGALPDFNQSANMLNANSASTVRKGVGAGIQNLDKMLRRPQDIQVAKTIGAQNQSIGDTLKRNMGLKDKVSTVNQKNVANVNKAQADLKSKLGDRVRKVEKPTLDRINSLIEQRKQPGLDEKQKQILLDEINKITMSDKDTNEVQRLKAILGGK